MLRLNVSVLLLTLATSVAAAGPGVPPLLNYQGLLQTSADSLLNGPTQIVFSIYAVAEGESALWSESHTVEVAEGRFHVLLGSVVPLPDGVFSDDERYLGVKVGDDPEMTPRQRIVSVAYALRAAQADNVSGKDVSPRSVAAGEGGITAPVVSTDSLVVGGRAVIVLDTIVVKRVKTSIELRQPFNRWEPIPEFSTALRLDMASLLDIQFTGAITTPGGLETRIVVKPVGGLPIEDAGNLSGIPPGVAQARSAAVSNTAVLDVDAATYLVYVQRFTQGDTGTLRTGILVIRVYRR
jgi:hypothetical protein